MKMSKTITAALIILTTATFNSASAAIDQSNLEILITDGAFFGEVRFR